MAVAIQGNFKRFVVTFHLQREIVRRDNSFQPLIIQMVDLYDNVASSLRTIFYIILRLNGPFPLLER